MTDKEKNTLKKGIVGIFDKFNILDHSSTIGGLKNDILSFINSMQQEPLRIKEGCRYRCLRNILNTDTGKFSFVKGKIYSSPRNDILIEETGVLCNTSEDSSGFELVEEPKSKFEQSIQEGDNVVYNEDLDCRVNLSQLDRVAKKEEPKKCMYTKDHYTDVDRKVLCDGCEEKCEYAQKEADWLQELQDKLDSLSKEDFEKVWAKYHQKEEPVSEQILSNVERIGKNWKEESDLNWKDMSLQEKKDLLASLQKDIEPLSENFEKEVEKMWAQESKCRDTDYTIAELTKQDYEDCAHHFANWQLHQMMTKAVDVTVHIDNGNYPYIPQMELYDYDKDIPLAKEGDKYKVILIKED